jgi:hypothetical protein
VSGPHDTVVNTRTGEVYPVSTVPGTVIEFYGDPRDLRWGPGIPIPVPGPPYVHAVLDAVGWEVEGLTWEWPKKVPKCELRPGAACGLSETQCTIPSLRSANRKLTRLA